MKELDPICDKYRVSGLTRGSVLTLDIGPLPDTLQKFESTVPSKYRTEIQVGCFVLVSKMSSRIQPNKEDKLLHLVLKSQAADFTGFSYKVYESFARQTSVSQAGPLQRTFPFLKQFGCCRLCTARFRK